MRGVRAAFRGVLEPKQSGEDVPSGEKRQHQGWEGWPEEEVSHKEEVER